MILWLQIQTHKLKMIAKRSNGCMRDAQSLLEQVNLLPEGITIKRSKTFFIEKAIANLLGAHKP